MTTRMFDDQRIWRKSSRSGDQGGNCVYIAADTPRIGIRDSKQGDTGPQLWLDAPTWTGLLTAIRSNNLR